MICEGLLTQTHVLPVLQLIASKRRKYLYWVAYPDRVSLGVVAYCEQTCPVKSGGRNTTSWPMPRRLTELRGKVLCSF